ncbi:hypothetical protein, partial [Rhizobium leguminosarum]
QDTATALAFLPISSAVAVADAGTIAKAIAGKITRAKPTANRNIFGLLQIIIFIYSAKIAKHPFIAILLN